ncbi:response regulator [Arsukibacterium sp.]|uniref:response regulator n=1 Tax=Arsukibacterium sp. TaxID=1977258 RepID=UPI002FDB76C9
MAEKKILLVDDVDYSRQLLRNNIIALSNEGQLKQRQYNFYNASCASNALSMFSMQKPDLIFLDIELPDCSGLDLLEKFKKSRPECIIIMVSANSTLENVQASLKAGASGFIVKPFTGDKILSALKLFERHCRITEQD